MDSNLSIDYMLTCPMCRNNHLRQHRQQLRDVTAMFSPPVRLMALNWSFDLPLSTIHRICSDRIQSRGENHQTLRPDGRNTVEDVLWKFLKGAEELHDEEVDVTVEMDVEEDLESSLKRAVDACVEILGVERPDVEKMGQAMAIIRGYQPTTKKRDLTQKAKVSEPRYYALLPEVDLETFMKGLMDGDQVPEDGKQFWNGLVKNRRLGERTPHVTVVHSRSLEGTNQQLWDRTRDLVQSSSAPSFNFKLGHLLWDDRVMAIAITDLAASANDTDPASEERTKAVEFVATLPQEIQDHLHVTVGTMDKDINPYEARLLVGRWQRGETEGIGHVELKDQWTKGGLKGLFK